MARPHVAVALLAAAAIACASYDDHREYRAAHPGWEPSFPRDLVALDELLAIVHAPPGARSTTAIVTRVVVLGLGTDPWERISLRKIRAGSFVPDPGRLYVVAARLQCLWTAAYTGTGDDDRRASGALVWYLVRDDRLLAYEHTRFLERCDTRDLVKGSVQTVPGFAQTLREHLDR
jgi:hypothetical protein